MRSAFPSIQVSNVAISFLVAALLFLSSSRGAPALPTLPALSPNEPFTFAVIGDNRAGDDGLQPEAFRQVIRDINAANPSFVLHAGDIIYGHTPDLAKARDMWRIYFETVASLKPPVFYAPGNHDIWDQPSARLYAEMIGVAYYKFDHAGIRFIALDSETAPGKIDPQQFRWLEAQLRGAEGRPIIIFLHRPLFPAGAGIGNSLDEFSAERDRLHQLFVRYRDQVRAVFLGHEHLYDFREKDGVRYYITGGAGSNLYAPPELGGFHHWLLVTVDTNRVLDVALKRVGAQLPPIPPARVVQPAELLESWEHGLIWYPWDYTVYASTTSDRSSDGQRALRLSFDLGQNPWPVLSLLLKTPWDLRNAKAVNIDLYVPDDLQDEMLLTTTIESTAPHKAPPLKLKPGWNKTRTAIDRSWVPQDTLAAVRNLSWTVTSASDRATRGSVIFDNFRLERPAAPPELLDSWESPLFWRVVDESVAGARTPNFARDGKTGLQVHFRFRDYPNPMLLSRLNPPWNLSSVQSLVTDLHVPDNLPDGLGVRLGLRAAEKQFLSPTMPVRKGWNRVEAKLSPEWLPAHVRSAAEQVEWVLSSTNAELKGSVVFDNFRAGAAPP